MYLSPLAHIGYSFGLFVWIISPQPFTAAGFWSTFELSIILLLGSDSCPQLMVAMPFIPFHYYSFRLCF